MRIEAKDFNLKYTLECGQFFHFKKLEGDTYIVVIKDKMVKIKQNKDILYIESFPKISENEIREFFNLNIDYKEIIDYLIKKDPNLEKMITQYFGLRIINQDIEECLFSYILSSFNSVKKVMLSVDLLSAYLGEKIKNDIFAFPTIDKLKNANIETLKLAKTGFRANYIKNTANIILERDIDLYKKEDNIKDTLMSFPGIGDKISDCIMLYSYRLYNVFPKDVWILRFLERKNSYPEIFQKYGGWAQIYIYSSMRYRE